MPDVSIFDLEGTSVDVKDATARSDIAILDTTVGTLSGDVAYIKSLSRLTVSYNSATETITFTNNVH